MSIHDLPNELLDEILSFVVPEINDRRVTPINRVCKRWNRPFMTRIVSNRRLPRNIDLLQAKFPKLTCFRFFESRHIGVTDFRLFKGHAFLRKLDVREAELVASVLDCPRLTSLNLRLESKLFFKDDHLNIFLALLPRLEYLELYVYSSPGLIEEHEQKLVSILENRPMAKLKHLDLSPGYVDFGLFCQLFQSSSLDSFENWNLIATPEQARKFRECFPNIRSLVIGHAFMLSLADIRFEHVTSLKLVLKRSFSFSSLKKTFPNLEVLDVHHYSIEFDLVYPTRLTHSIMSFIGSVQPRLFCHLKVLEWSVKPDQFNYIMQELGVHCLQLTTIRIKVMHSLDCRITPKLDGFVFPLLTDLDMDVRNFELNSSLLQFLTRHGQLRTLSCNDFVAVEKDLEFVESDQPAWPALRKLSLGSIAKPKIRDWFFRNAGKVRRRF